MLMAWPGLGRRWDEPRARDVFRDVSDQPATPDLETAFGLDDIRV